SGPWQKKQFSDRMERTWWLKEIRSGTRLAPTGWPPRGERLFARAAGPLRATASSRRSSRLRLARRRGASVATRWAGEGPDGALVWGLAWEGSAESPGAKVGVESDGVSR